MILVSIESTNETEAKIEYAAKGAERGAQTSISTSGISALR
jgi:hypothetical protein